MADLLNAQWELLARIAEQDDGVIRCSDEELSLARRLSDIGCIVLKHTTYGNSHDACITDVGRSALDEHRQLLQRIEDDKHEQRAREEREEAQRIKERKQQFRHDWLIAGLSFLGGSFCTFLVEHVIIPLVRSWTG